MRAPRGLLGGQRQHETARTADEGGPASQEDRHETYAEHGQHREAEHRRRREDDVAGSARRRRLSAQLPPGEGRRGEQQHVEPVAGEAGAWGRIGDGSWPQRGRHERRGEQDSGGQHGQHQRPGDGRTLLEPGGGEVAPVGQARVQERRSGHGDRAGDEREQRGLCGRGAELLAAPEPHRHEQVPLVLADGPDQPSRQERSREGQRRAEEQDHQHGGRCARPLGVEVRERAGHVGRQPGQPGPVADPRRQQPRCVVEQPPGLLQRGVAGEGEGGVGGDPERVDRGPAADERLLVDDERAVGRRRLEPVAVGRGEARTAERVALPLQDGAWPERADHHERHGVVDAAEATLLAQRDLVAGTEPQQARGRVGHHDLGTTVVRRRPPAGRQVRSGRQRVGRDQVGLAVGARAVRLEVPEP